jgi:hypothetical protein
LPIITSIPAKILSEVGQTLMLVGLPEAARPPA